MNLKTGRTIREIAIENPAAVRVFEALGIDYCCGGNRSLDEACRRASVPPDTALRLLAMAGRQSGPREDDWSGASLSELIAHIVEQHHSYVRREAARLFPMLDKAVARHGAAHPELKHIRDLFGPLADELFSHMMKEEHVLFPYLVRMETALHDGSRPPAATFGSIEFPISRMLAEHDDAGELLRQIRTVSSDFHPPEDACATYHALYHGLEEFERDLHRHVHLENNILFPRAFAMERESGQKEGVDDVRHDFPQ